MAKPGWTALKRLLQEDGIAGGPELVLGLDFDGTLSSLVRHPGRARLPARTRRLLAELARRKTTLAIISGRSVADLKTKITIPGIYLSGNHGLEIDGPGCRWRHARAAAAGTALRDLERRLSPAIEIFPGVQLEHKGLSMSVHFRRALPGTEALLRKLIRRLLGAYRGRLMLTGSKLAWEVRPKTDWNKGLALLKIAALAGRRRRVLFAGDDRTDEEGFKTLGRKALTVRVGPAKGTFARFVLEDQRRVPSLLAFLSRA